MKGRRGKGIGIKKNTANAKKFKNKDTKQR